ncbi:HD domain-containing protein 2 [Blattella germanica]|nr:HD domain-containing protein 2 [Blattella germanica]
MAQCEVLPKENPAMLLEFLQLVGRLKSVKRTGWVLRHVGDPESVASHMYRMGILTFLFDNKDNLDKTRCLKLAVVHDLAECIVGDITPRCGVDPDEKHRREDEAMKELADLAGSCGNELYQLYKEYEEQRTPEAKLVKELDRFDMILQAFEYEKLENRPHDLQEFFDSTEGKFSHPLVKSLVAELDKQRSEFETKG